MTIILCRYYNGIDITMLNNNFMKQIYNKVHNVFTDSIGWILVETAVLVSYIGATDVADTMYDTGCDWYNKYIHPDE